jgi:hypothetical protein
MEQVIHRELSALQLPVEGTRRVEFPSHVLVAPLCETLHIQVWEDVEVKRKG